MAMVRAKKLQFRVAYASTEDGEYPARELNTHSPHTRGWQSAKLCAYPQEIVLQFDGLVRLSALQILSNECKIAQKIELFVGTCPRSQLDPPSIQASEFRRLGYLSLDSNEQSQWRARELKDVNLSKSGKDTTAQFLKLVIHQNHINNVNIHGQVGIMAVNALGEEMHPFVQDTDMEGSLGGMSRAIAPPASTAHNVALDVNFDPQSATAVRAMIAAKQRAVEEENYDEAKVLKAAIETLQKLGGQIAKLEARKRDAVQREDYDEAKGIKQQVDVLRNEVAAVQRAAETGQPMSAPSPAQHSAPPAQAHAQAQAQVQQPAQPVVTMSRLAEPAPEEPFTAALTKPAAPSSPVAEPARSAASTKPMALPEFPGDKQIRKSPSQPASSLNTAAETNPGQQQQQQQQTVSEPPTAAAQPVSTQLPSLHQSRKLPTQGGQASVSAPIGATANEPLPPGGASPDGEPVPGLPEPEPLSATARKQAITNGLVDIFEPRIIQCLFSKTWALRESACRQIADTYTELQGDKAAVFRASCYLLNSVFSDRIAQVFLAGRELLQKVLSAAQGEVRRPDVLGGVSTLLPVLLDKTSESNARIKMAAHETLLLLAKSAAVGPGFVGKVALEPPSKSTAKGSWKFQLGRLGFLAQLIGQCGIEDGSGHGFGLDPVMGSVVESMNHQNEKVRGAAIEVAAACYQHVGRGIDRYTAGFNNLQEEMLHAACQRVDVYGSSSGPAAGASGPAPHERPRSGHRGEGTRHNEENVDPFAAKPKIRNSVDSDDARLIKGGRPPSSGGAAVPQNSGDGDAGGGKAAGNGGGGGGGGGSGGRANRFDTVDPFAAKPKIRNSFDPPAPSPTRKQVQPVDSAPQGYREVSEVENPFARGHEIRNSVAAPASALAAGSRAIVAPEDDEYADEEDLEIPAFAQEAFDRGTAQFEDDQCEAAQQSFTEAMRAGHPDVASCLTERGRCFSFLGRNDEALQDYDEAIRLDPDDDVLYQNRGTQLWIMGQLQEAEADFQRMVDLNPNCDEEARAALEKVREELRANGMR